jgi:hypothetical protein
MSEDYGAPAGEPEWERVGDDPTVTNPPPAPPGYCDSMDVEAAIGRPLPADRDVSTLIGAASDLIDGYLKMSVALVNTVDANGNVISSAFPPMVVRVCAEMVANVLNRPQPSTPANMPDPYNAPAFQYHIGPQSIGPWLNQSQQMRLNRLRKHYRALGVVSETTGYFVRYGIADLSTSMQLDMYDLDVLGTDDELFNQQLGP